MNWAEMATNWNSLRSVVQAHWPGLTDDDVARIGGDRVVLACVLQERLGLTVERAEEEICAFEKDVRRPGAVK